MNGIPLDRSFLTLLLRLTVSLLLKTGTQLEVEYRLRVEYGVPIHSNPLSYTGTIKLGSWRQWIKNRQLLEKVNTKGNSQFPKPGAIECPDFTSVVFRHGGTFFEHPPNKVFRTIMDDYLDNRTAANNTPQGKARVLTEVINETRQIGFSFLTWDGNWYYKIHDEQTIRRLVAQAMRDAIKRRMARTNQQEEEGDMAGIFVGQEAKRRRIDARPACEDGEGTGSGGGGGGCITWWPWKNDR